MKTIIGTKQDVVKELTALVADVLARKPEANIAVSAVDLPAEVLDALAASDIAFDKAKLFQACEYCGAAGKGAHAVGAAFSSLMAAKPFAAVHARIRTQMPSTRRITTLPFRQPAGSIW